jgi:hypothetical protein
VNGNIERLTPFRDLWFLRGGPLLQLFDGGFTGVYDREEIGYDGLKPRFDICPKCRTQLLRVLLNEKCKLEKLLSSIFEWESCPIIESGPKPRVDLEWNSGLSGDTLVLHRGEVKGRTSSICGYEDMVGLLWGRLKGGLILGTG